MNVIRFLLIVPELERWIKLNEEDVCFGLNGGNFGSFTTTLGMDATHFKLVHKSGTVGVDLDTQFWNHVKDNFISVYVTSDSDNILAPAGFNTATIRSEWLSTYGPSETEIILPLMGSTYIRYKETLRLWYARALKNGAGYDSGSSNKICADVYGWGNYMYYLKIVLFFFSKNKGLTN